MPCLAPLLPLLAAFAGAGLDDEPAWNADYIVRFVTDEDHAHRAEVEAVLHWNKRRGSAPEEVELGMASGYPDGYGAFVRDLAAFVPEGTRAPKDDYLAEAIDAAEGRHRLPVLPDGTAAFRYVVPLDHDPSTGIGWDETPHPLEDAVLWTGRALFVAPGDARIRVALVPPDAEHVSTSLTPDEEEKNAYLAVDAHALRESYFVVGRHVEREIMLKGATILLVVDAGAAEAVELIESSVRTFVETAMEAVGGPPPERCLVAVTTCADEGGGSVYGHSAHVLVKGPPTADGPDGWRRVLCHEIFHLWNPTLIGFDSREMWYSEGFTEYYSHRLLVEAGLLEGATFREVVAEWIRAYQGEAGTIGLRQAGELGAKNRTLIYQGGAVAALCLDVSIRAKSRGKRSLDDVMTALYELCGKGRGDDVPIAELERLLGKLGGRSLKGFVERHVAGSELLPVADNLAEVGLQLEDATVALPEMDAVVHLVQSSGMTVVPDGIRFDRTTAAGLRPEDVLLEVEGGAITDFGDLRRALADRAPGDKVAIVVRRDGKRRDVNLRLGGHGEELPFREERIVRLVPLPKAGKAARALHETFFGKATGK